MDDGYGCVFKVAARAHMPGKAFACVVTGITVKYGTIILKRGVAPIG